MSRRYHQLRSRARKMRKNPTHAERILWGKLRKRRMLGYKFRRQHILAPHIVDFYCIKAKLVIEVDGAVHSDTDSVDSDQRRDRSLQRGHDVDILRFTNQQVRRKLPRVLATIRSFLRDSSCS